MDEFEEAFQVIRESIKFPEMFFSSHNRLILRPQHCLHVLTKQDRQPYDDDVIKLEVEQTTMNFINLARQIEVFFLQKRFLLSTLKPELLLIEENYDLKHELQRKEELIKKHYDKIEYWKKILSDQPAKPTMPANVPPPVGAIPPVGPSGQLNPNMHMQQQIQMQQQQQQQVIWLLPLPRLFISLFGFPFLSSFRFPIYFSPLRFLRRWLKLWLRRISYFYSPEVPVSSFIIKIQLSFMWINT